MKNTENAPVWVKGEYVRSEKAYECWKYKDCMHIGLFRGKKLVYTEFKDLNKWKINLSKWQAKNRANTRLNNLRVNNN